MEKPKLGIYKHYKGNHYHLLGFATHTETEEVMAIYQALYGDMTIWVRPLEQFLEKVLVPDSNPIPRFEFIDSALNWLKTNKPFAEQKREQLSQLDALFGDREVC